MAQLHDGKPPQSLPKRQNRKRKLLCSLSPKRGHTLSRVLNVRGASVFYIRGSGQAVFCVSRTVRQVFLPSSLLELKPERNLGRQVSVVIIMLISFKCNIIHGFGDLFFNFQ